MSTLTVIHTHASGSILLGTERGDHSQGILRRNAWRYSRTIPGWYLPSTRDKDANETILSATATQLRAIGFQVEWEIDNTPRTAGEREASVIDRAAARQQNLRAAAAAAYSAAERASAALSRADASLPPGGEPIHVGHHSEGAHRKALAAARAALSKSVSADQAATRAHDRAHAHEASMKARYNPVTVAKRIARLEKQIHDIQRKLDGHTHTFPGGYRETTPPASGAYAARLTRQRNQLEEDLSMWQGIREEQLRTGEAAEYSPNTIAVGDLIAADGTVYRVARLNPKSVSVDMRVGYGTVRGTIPYTHITAHMPAPVGTVSVGADRPTAS